MYQNNTANNLVSTATDLPVNKNTSYVLVDASSGSRVITLPSPTLLGGKEINVVRKDSTQNIIRVNGSSDFIYVDRMQKFVSDGSYWWPTITVNISTEEVAYTPTGSWVTNVTYTGFWYRENAHMTGTIHMAFGGAPDNTALTVNLPTGYSMDTTKLTTRLSSVTPILGHGTGYPASNVCSFWLTYGGTSSMWVLSALTSANPSKIDGLGPSTPYVWANGNSMSLKYTVPISGWSLVNYNKQKI